MKRYLYIITALVILYLIIPVACTKMDDTYKKYLEGGEIIYSTKIDSVFYYPGDERVEIKGYLKNAMQVKDIVIQWKKQDNTVDTCNIPYDYLSMPDSFSYILPVPEGQYIFVFTTENEQGNTSVPFQKGARVYGSQYKSYLTNRSISSISPTPSGQIKIVFDNAVSGMVITNINYKTVAGETKTVSVLPSDESLLLGDCDFSVPINYASGYLPEAMAIDTFYCESSALDLSSVADMLFTLDETEFSIISYSSQEDPANEGGINGPAANIIDGNTDSYWQSEWSAQTAQLPHQITVDMHYAWNVFSIQLFRRPYTPHTKTVELEGSLDGSNWASLGTIEYSSDASDNSQTLDIPNGQRVRYLRINITDSYALPYASLAELIVMGKL